MKKTKAMEILVVLFFAGSIFGLFLTGYRFNKSSTGLFTLTGIPSRYNGKYAYFMGSNVDYVVDADYVAETVAIISANLLFNSRMRFPQIKGGSVTLPLRYVDISYTDISIALENLASYRRSEALQFTIYIYDQEIVELSIMDDWICKITFNSVVFSNGNAKRVWSATDDVYERR